MRDDSEPGGWLTLERMGRLKNYNRWILDGFDGRIGNRILEVGSGTGNMTRLLYGRELIVATDAETPYLHALRNRFAHVPTIEVEPLDLENDECLVLRRYDFDTIVCLNVLEHIEDDAGALTRMFELLRPGGRLLLFVPADQSLFGTMDSAVGHHRRYSLDEAQEKLRRAGFAVEKAVHQNWFGRFAWWMNGRVFRRRHVPAAQSRIFDSLVPLFRALEGPAPRAGLSIVAVARKP